MARAADIRGPQAFQYHTVSIGPPYPQVSGALASRVSRKGPRSREVWKFEGSQRAQQVKNPPATQEIQEMSV